MGKKEQQQLHQVEIPEVYLLAIAIGSMGDEELLNLIRTWAFEECKRLDLGDSVVELQRKRLAELEIRLKNALGHLP